MPLYRTRIELGAGRGLERVLFFPRLQRSETLSRNLLSGLRLLAFLSLWLSGVAPGSAGGERYPAEIYQAIYVLSLFKESRHLRLIYECIQDEDPALIKRTHSGAAARRHGWRKITSLSEFDQSTSVLAFVKGEPYALPHSAGRKALTRFIEGLLADPRFPTWYKKYVSKLELRERIAIGALELVYPKPKLLRTLGAGFVQKHILELSNKYVAQLKRKWQHQASE